MIETFARVIRPALIGAAILTTTISQAEARTFNVNCNGNKTIQGAVDSASPGDRIDVSGTCNEQVIISTANLRIDAPNGATIDGTGVALDVSGLIRINAPEVVIRNFVIQNSENNGITITRSGSGLIFDNTIQDNANHGISVQSGAAALIGFSGIQDRHNRPSEVGESDGNTIQNNGGHGISLRNGASAVIAHNDIMGVKDGNNSGIQVRGAHADIDSNLIDGFDRGINLFGNSTASLSDSNQHNGDAHGGANIITNNDDGVRCRVGGAILAGDEGQDYAGNGTNVDVDKRGTTLDPTGVALPLAVLEDMRGQCSVEPTVEIDATP